MLNPFFPRLDRLFTKASLSVAFSLLLAGGGVAQADNENLALGNPSQAKLFVAEETNDLNNLLVEHPAFTLAFDQSNGGPKWVSWHLAQSDRGKTGRSEDFRPDALLPESSQIRPNDYRGSGYDRGHICPSGDRTADKALNSTTFLMSNMLPQTPDLNRQLWRKFEEYCRDQLRTGENEIYLISGGVGAIERIADGKVNVPTHCWKVAVILPTGDEDLKRIDKDTRVVAILTPNQNGTEISQGAWRDYLTSVDKIEELTGLDLLSNLSVELQAILEAKVDSGRAPRGEGAKDEAVETGKGNDNE
ncbi:DNA/RNA non-specific endonuclease [bacterium]|nr:MAG: DNA/RNA non-specific endonuclease [bacterium]